MRRIIFTSVIGALIVAVAATFGIQHFTQASTVTPYDADVDHDGHVTILDLSNVARYFGQPAPLATAVPLLREAQVVITEVRAGLNYCGNNTGCLSGYQAIQVPIDGTRYPQGTTFRLWIVGHQDFGQPTCTQIMDVTDGFPGIAISGSQVCLVSPLPDTGTFSPTTFALPSTQRVYSLAPLSAANGTIVSARVIATVN
jgi:hypothetical protein